MEKLAEVIEYLSKGDRNAVKVLIELFKTYSPEEAFDTINKLERYEIFGDSIWNFYKKQNEDIHQFVSFFKNFV